MILKTCKNVKNLDKPPLRLTLETWIDQTMSRSVLFQTIGSAMRVELSTSYSSASKVIISDHQPKSERHQFRLKDERILFDG